MQHKTRFIGGVLVILLLMAGAVTVSGHTKYRGGGDTPLYSLRTDLATRGTELMSERVSVEYVNQDDDGSALGFTPEFLAGGSNATMLLAEGGTVDDGTCWTAYPSVDCIQTCYSNPCPVPSTYGGSIDCETVYPQDPSCPAPTTEEVGCTTLLHAGGGSQCHDGKPDPWWRIALDILSLASNSYCP